ncbi:MAG TPA: FecR domain-containing protein [Rhodanobacteraceae bacterium]|nr:FecR domain-containing protein [Rhodanobacteraceae bacterium]
MNRGSAQIERVAAAWLARRDGDHWSTADQVAFAAWLEADAAHRVVFLRLDAAWRETGRLKALSAGARQDRPPARGEWARSPYFASHIGNANAMTGGHGRTVHATTRRRRRRWPMLAGLVAGLLIAVVAGGFAWRDLAHVERGTWRTAIGARQVVHLSDGSTATLGSDTGLSVAFSRSLRNLDLTQGEAFFDVAHNAARPFVVHAGAYRVIAVGTRFDVRRDADKLRVVVTRGLVRLQSGQDPAQAPAMLPAGSIATIDGDDVAIRRVPLDQAVEFLSWRDGYVVFHGTPLAEAIREFNRYNARKIVIADPSLDELKVGGNFRLDNSDAFVRLLQKVFPVRATQHAERIVLSRRAHPKPSD